MMVNIRSLSFKGNECPYQVRKYTGSESPDVCSLDTDICILEESLECGIYKRWLLKGIKKPDITERVCKKGKAKNE